MTAKSSTRLFGTTARQVACIGQGTWKIDDSAADGSLTALRRGLDPGLTHIDPAEMYGSGASERIVGNAISGRRDEVFLVSKVLPNHASHSGVAAACEKSLAHLRTDRLDCYLLHWRGGVPFGETVAPIETLGPQGQILSLGGRHFCAPGLSQGPPRPPPPPPPPHHTLYPPP